MSRAKKSSGKDKDESTINIDVEDFIRTRDSVSPLSLAPLLHHRLLVIELARRHCSCHSINAMRFYTTKLDHIFTALHNTPPLSQVQNPTRYSFTMSTRPRSKLLRAKISSVIFGSYFTRRSVDNRVPPNPTTYNAPRSYHNYARLHSHSFY